MILNGKVMIAIIRKNRVTIRMVARELGVSLEEWKRVLTQRSPLGMTESEQLLAMFGAKDMARAIDWEALHARCPV